MLWLALTVLAAGAAFLVALPFLRTRASAPTTTPVDIYKAQLESLSNDRAAGEVDEAAAAEIKTEIEHRILSAPEIEPQVGAPDQKLDRLTAIAVAALVLLGSAALYVATGSPNMQSASRASISGIAGGSLPDVDTLIERLRARLEEAPEDAEGWRMLGWSYFETNRFPEAVDAYGRAVAQQPDNASYGSALAEAITQANGGTVNAEARRGFQQAVARDRSDERARYYLALARAQGGDVRGAIDAWIEGVRAAGPDSQWAGRMRAEAETAAQRAGIDIAGRMPPATAGDGQAPTLTPDVVASAQQSTPEAQQQMIAGMVNGLEARLAEDPRDADRWIMLMRSRMVLGEPDRARAALQASLRAFNNDTATQRQLRAAAAELGVPGT